MNAQKLAIAIGLLKDRKCVCGTHTATVSCESIINIPISEIDGVKNLDCDIHFYNNKKGLGFSVRADFKWDEEDEANPRLYFKSKWNENGIDKDDILEFSKQLLIELPHLQMTLIGRLAIRDNEYLSLCAAFEDVFTAIQCENVKVDKTLTCSVCYEKTKTLTPCKHPLCNRCWSKIEKKEEDNETPCPLCRENIYFV